VIEGGGGGDGGGGLILQRKEARPKLGTLVAAGRRVKIRGPTGAGRRTPPLAGRVTPGVASPICLHSSSALPLGMVVSVEPGVRSLGSRTLGCSLPELRRRAVQCS
jgi:hypothetical protein